MFSASHETVEVEVLINLLVTDFLNECILLIHHGEDVQWLQCRLLVHVAITVIMTVNHFEQCPITLILNQTLHQPWLDIINLCRVQILNYLQYFIVEYVYFTINTFFKLRPLHSTINLRWNIDTIVLVLLQHVDK